MIVGKNPIVRPQGVFWGYPIVSLRQTHHSEHRISRTKCWLEMYFCIYIHTTDVRPVEWSTVIEGEVSLFMHWIFEDHRISAMFNHFWTTTHWFLIHENAFNNHTCHMSLVPIANAQVSRNSYCMIPFLDGSINFIVSNPPDVASSKEWIVFTPSTSTCLVI